MTSDLNNDIDVLRECIENIKALPPVPTVFSKILECLEDPKSGARDLQELILYDQALTAKVLSLANSAMYGYSQRVTNVSRAVAKLGFQTVTEIVISVSILSGLRNCHKSNQLDMLDFWKYSMGCAEAAKIVARLIRYADTEKAYIIGLLHDIGKPVFIQILTNRYDDILNRCRTERSDLLQLEMRELRCDHSIAGELLANEWRLPADISAAIRHHHSLDSLPDDYMKEICIAHMAEFLTRKAGIGSNGEKCPPSMHVNVVACSELSDRQLRTMEDHMNTAVPKLNAIFEAIL